jgi:hypothetical protein
LSALERACLRSIVRMGHQLTLYCYDEPHGVPEGVIVEDAALILPRSTIVRHQSGSVALFSDRFRFELQRRDKGLWVDTDVYLLAPLRYPPDRPIFGWLDARMLGAAVLRLPPDSPVIDAVLALFERPVVPTWLRPPDRVRAHWRAWRTGGVDLATLPWGVAGPAALTVLARRNGLLHYAEPRDVFYSYGWEEAAWIFDPRQSIDAHVTPQTRALHLYNYMVARRKDTPAAAGSFMARLQQEGA